MLDLRHLLLAVTLAASPAIAADRLPALRADPGGTSVSGLSSGAYMAGQFHVAFSQSVIGAGIVAGGPFGCSEGSVTYALERCMDTALGAPDPARLFGRAEAQAAAGRIDPLAGLADDRVYIFSGTADATVTPPVVATVPDFYQRAGVPAAQIAVVDDKPAGHAFVTLDTGNPCGETGSPYVNDCGYDQAEAILTQIYGPLAPPSTTPAGKIVEFDQMEFLPDPMVHGVDLTGFLYVPDACAATPGCRVHVVFHGCRQTASLVEDAVYDGVGYNRWADTNRLILLYPQTHTTGLNPNACWDWWGYDDPAFATRDGRQMAAVHAMLGRLAATEMPDPFCADFSASNLGHWQAERARVCQVWFFCAIGTGEALGWAAATTTLYETSPGNYGTAVCSG